jgi:segregation and condensation protein A
MSYSVRIKNFDGPFDLLVYLVERARMDIYDIEISQITSDYLAYIEEAHDARLDLSPEFLVLAATLMEIKSYMLLPHSEETEAEADDPKRELQRKLIEYKRFKTLSEKLGEMLESGLAVRAKPQEDYYELFGQKDELLNLPMDKFINAFLLFIEKKQMMKDMEERYVDLEHERQTQEEKMAYISDMFRKLSKNRLAFSEILAGRCDAGEKVLSFVSVLEMNKENQLDLWQEAPFAEIYLEQKEQVAVNQ